MLVFTRLSFSLLYLFLLCRYDKFVEGSRSVRDCQEILRVAKPDFLNLFGKLITDDLVSDSEKTMYRYYCQAVMVLRHFQRPGAVEGMTVSASLLTAYRSLYL